MIKYLVLLGMIIALILSFVSPDLLRIILAIIACIPLIAMLVAVVGYVWLTFFEGIKISAR